MRLGGQEVQEEKTLKGDEERWKAMNVEGKRGKERIELFAWREGKGATEEKRERSRRR